MNLTIPIPITYNFNVCQPRDDKYNPSSTNYLFLGFPLCDCLMLPYESGFFCEKEKYKQDFN